VTARLQAKTDRDTGGRSSRSAKALLVAAVGKSLVIPIPGQRLLFRCFRFLILVFFDTSAPALGLQNGAQGAVTAETRRVKALRSVSSNGRIVVQAQEVFLGIVRLIHGRSSLQALLNRSLSRRAACPHSLDARQRQGVTGTLAQLPRCTRKALLNLAQTYSNERLLPSESCINCISVRLPIWW
jgi:hypothetical protein